MQQHAALSILKVYCIQFHVLRQTQKLSFLDIMLRFRWHSYSTFELRLLCNFLAICVNFTKLIRHATTVIEKSKLICSFCVVCRVKTFVNIADFWTHIVHQHQAVFDNDRLREIVRIAILWRKYWNLYNSEDKRHYFIISRLRQALQSNFN